MEIDWIDKKLALLRQTNFYWGLMITITLVSAGSIARFGVPVGLEKYILSLAILVMYLLIGRGLVLSYRLLQASIVESKKMLEEKEISGRYLEECSRLRVLPENGIVGIVTFFCALVQILYFIK